MKKLVILTATVSLLMVDYLAFHDFREPHTFRDWLTLFASALVFIHAARELSRTRTTGYSS